MTQPKPRDPLRQTASRRLLFPPIERRHRRRPGEDDASSGRGLGRCRSEVAVSGADKSKKALVKLAAGKKTGATVSKGKDCQIDLYATFADGQTMEANAVDVWTQKILNLTD